MKIRGDTLRVNATLGKLSLTDDSELTTRAASFKQILSIEGDNFANFGYQTFDPKDKNTFCGINSAVSLRSGALRVTFLVEPLRDIYMFLIKFAKLKGLYDAAAQVAAQRASEIQRMQFNVSVQSPILVFPRSPADSEDMLVMKLGEIVAHNAYEDVLTKTTASLQGIQLTSEMHHKDGVSRLKILDDVEITADIIQTGGIDRNVDLEFPDTQVACIPILLSKWSLTHSHQIQIKISDVMLHLTQVQYCIVMELARSIPNVLSAAPEVEAESQPPSSASHLKLSSPSNPSVVHTHATNLQPEVEPTSSAEGVRTWTSVDVLLTVKAVELHLYDHSAAQESDLKASGIARFALNDNILRYKALSDGATEAELVLKSFTMSNIRTGPTRFREIIPAAQHHRNQFMVLYTRSGDSSPSSLAIVTVDSPKIIFSVDPVFALLTFFSSAFKQETAAVAETTSFRTVSMKEQATHRSSLDFRVDLHDVTISVLESDSVANTQAIQLSIKQVLASQQVGPLSFLQRPCSNSSSLQREFSPLRSIALACH